MSRSKTKELVDPVLSEFIYTISMTAPISQKRHLPEKFFNAIKSEKAAKKFSKTASTDQKKEFLEYMGYNCFWIISNVNNLWTSAYREVLKKFQTPKGKIDLGEVIKERLFVTSDKEMVRIFGQMSASISSKLFRLEHELFRIKNANQRWSNKLDADDSGILDTQEKQSINFCKFARIVVREHWFSHGYLEIGPNELSILLFLYENKSKYISHEQIKDELRGFIPLNKITQVEKNLLDQIFIQAGFDYRKKEFTITARGILAINRFRDRVVKLNSFN